jgi:hypothetical protein
MHDLQRLAKIESDLEEAFRAREADEVAAPEFGQLLRRLRADLAELSRQLRTARRVKRAEKLSLPRSTRPDTD